MATDFQLLPVEPTPQISAAILKMLPQLESIWVRLPGVMWLGTAMGDTHQALGQRNAAALYRAILEAAAGVPERVTSPNSNVTGNGEA